MREEIPKEKRKIGSIVITADKGLAGAYNHNIVKVEDEILEEPGEHKLFVVGELGRHYYANKGVEIDTNFLYRRGYEFSLYGAETDHAQGKRYRGSDSFPV